MAQKKYVGIDLGTSTSGLAHVKADGTPEIVPNNDGERLTPSIVYFDRYDGVKLVGSAARDGGDPDRTVHNIKKHMDDPSYTIEMDGQKWTPTEISALILAKLKQDCSNIIGEIDEVVITVPANFNELARNATTTACRLAGLKVSRLVNEPTAAALYYAHTQDISGKVMVYDLGGGTLDITILNIKGQKIDILLSEGARHLGGSNFDEILIEILAQEYQKKNGADLFQDERQRRKVLTTSEDAKKMLSKLKHITETVGNDTDGSARIDLTRELFEDAISKLLTRTVMLVEQALDSLDLKPSDIDHVVMVGGSTRMPIVPQTLRDRFGFKPVSCGNVDECVCLGAALFAKQARQVSEVCNQSYGTVAIIEDAATGKSELRNSIVIPKNTPIPCSMSQTYITSEDNEELIEVEITQGEDTDPQYVDIVGKISLKVPAGRPAGCEVTVTYSYDQNQRVKASVTDEKSGKRHNIEIEYKGDGVLSEKDIERKSAYLKQITIV
ncbi:MAG: Hsp70 family protein [Verrucomicrobiales bacterium]|nr:Hsp70 family protein [Verrucomicrobiales bacterium]